MSAELPATGSNKVRKQELAVQRWHTADDVYRWAGRGGPAYRRMTDADRRALDAEFTVYGRARHL